ncbi:1-deoxy-D-xylulose-5-phosphate synthase [Enorma massiliensis]|uniref:1-deoxy-D-xylulose-5-phosphate synthase n=1 Tax=Enorma massiliensis TaxID=1472761 RepID=UPI003A8E9543
MLLEHIASPRDVKALDATALPQLCDEVRRAILENAAAVGGHLAPNLGVVELTVALHRVFDSPRDKIIFDVSHQSYAHKVLTGRAAAFTDPAHYGEVSGFSNPHESEHDFFSMGHTSTSISLACGLAKARDLAGERYNVVAVIGDGSLSGGLAFEGLDNAAVLNSGIVIVVNDNDQSIAENHGGIYGCLARLRTSGGTASNNIFRAMGFDYRYLEEGNDVDSLVEALEALRGIDHPVVLHVHTTKGAGYDPAERAPEVWHHVGSFDIESGRKHTLISGDVPEGTYADITGAHLLEAMKRDPRVVGVTAGMPYVMGFTQERRAQAGQQFVDVGIAEEHAVTMAAGMAAGGMKPYVAIYSTFLERSFDQMLVDVCRNSLPVTFLIDRAGLVGADGSTHQGVYDLSYLRLMPNMIVAAPRDVRDLKKLLSLSAEISEPMAIRYPKDGDDMGPGIQSQRDFRVGEWELLSSGGDVMIFAVGRMVQFAMQASIELMGKGLSAGVVDARFVKPMDEKMLVEQAKRVRLAVMVEENALAGGFGEGAIRVLEENGVATDVMALGVPDRFIGHGTIAEQLAECELDAYGIARRILARWKEREGRADA